MAKKYLILPGCDDQNRGDQALVWETVRLAKEAGYIGDYYLMTDSKIVNQSVNEGIKIFSPILLHPSRVYKNDDNLTYGWLLKLKWGAVAFCDLLFTISLLIPLLKTLVLFLSNKGIKQSYKIIQEADAVFVKGGGFIHAYGGATATYTIYYVLYHLILALFLNKAVYVMPNSFGPFDGPFVKSIIRNVLLKCKLVASRESVSTKALGEQLGISVDTYPDLAFYLERENYEAIKKELINKGIPVEVKKCVAITVRPYRFPDHDNPKQAYEEFKNSMVEFIRWLANNNYYPVLIEHTYCDKVHERDIECIHDITARLKDVDYKIFTDLTLNCRQLKAVYACFDYIVGTRFHSVIFSLAEDVPGIAITYGGNKGEGIMSDMQLAEYAIPMKDLSSEKLRNTFITLISNENIVKKKINNYRSGVLEKRKELIKVMKGKSVSETMNLKVESAHSTSIT